MEQFMQVKARVCLKRQEEQCLWNRVRVAPQSTGHPLDTVPLRALGAPLDAVVPESRGYPIRLLRLGSGIQL